MKEKINRIEILKLLISSNEMHNQEELLTALAKEGFHITQATLSRDLKQLKVAKAASMNGTYTYVLPNETMYRRISTPKSASEMLNTPGLISLEFSGNTGVIRTRPGYASAIAYNIDNSQIPDILGTIAGDDTIIFILSEGASRSEVRQSIKSVI